MSDGKVLCCFRDVQNYKHEGAVKSLARNGSRDDDDDDQRAQLAQCSISAEAAEGVDWSSKCASVDSVINNKCPTFPACWT